MKILVVIPARSGSKGVPNKNIRVIHGKPLLAHSIDYAKRSCLVDDIVVSTDSEDYAVIAQRYGAKVPFIRPKNLAEDDTQDYPVMLHALLESERIYKKIYDVLILLRPTSPVRQEGLIEKGIKLLNDSNADSIRAVTPVSEHAHRQWILENGFIRGLFDSQIKESYNLPRQELPKLVFQTGDIEIVRRNTLVELGSVSGEKVMPLFVNDYYDIDSERDIKKLKNRTK